MYIVIYRPHNRLNIETRYIGPVATLDDALNRLEELPALGQYIPDDELNNPGVKFVEMLLHPDETRE